jgi:phosphoribosylformylglycinamidine synthase
MSTNAPSDAAIVNIKGTNRALAMTTDCNSRYVFSDPEIGAAIAVSEAARNITCSGGKPLAITNCLNFGNPYNPEVYWQFVGAVNGMGNACRKFETPVTGGNVSFYNQSTINNVTEPVFPTPTIGMIGLLEKTHQMTLDFKKKGDIIYLIGSPKNDINCSEYLYSYHKVKLSPPPYFNLNEEYVMQAIVQKLIRLFILQSVHDISEGGLFISLLESAMPNNMGFSIRTNPNFRKDAFLFGESQSRVVVSIEKKNEGKFKEIMEKLQFPFQRLGYVTHCKIVVDEQEYGVVEDYKKLYDNVIANAMSH